MIRLLKKNIVPLLYAVAICSMIMDLFVENMVVSALFILLVQGLLFGVGSLETEYPGRYGIYYLILGIGISVVLFFLFLLSGTGIKQFFSWITSSGANSNIWYLMAFFIIVNVIMGGFVYYCVVINYRIFLNFLLVVIPFLFYYKMGAIFASTYAITLCVLFFLSVLYCRNKGFAEGTVELVDKRYKWYLALFFAIGCIPAIFLPKTFITPFSLQDMNMRWGLYESTYGLENEKSEDGKSIENPNAILFYVEADGPLYLKKDVFDQYSESEKRWGKSSTALYAADSTYNNVSKQWEAAVEGVPYVLGYDRLYEEIARKVEEDPGFQQLYQIDAKELGQIKSTLKELRVGEMSIPMTLIAHPQNVKEVASYIPEKELKELEQMGGKDAIKKFENQWIVKRNYHEMIYLEQPPSSLRYKVKYVQYDADSQEVQKRFAIQLDDEKYAGILSSLEDSSYYEEYRMANFNTKSHQENANAFILDLAKSVTADCKSDYEKAVAVEQYFQNGDFEYDLTVSSSETGIEYFLSEGKKGSCSDYATAMVLMMQSVGIPTRYTEGFLVTEYDSAKKAYVVRAVNSHAFPEVYINGMGWTIFEPTVSLGIAKEEKISFWEWLKSSNLFTLEKSLQVLAIAIVLLSVLMLLGRVIYEQMFRLKLRALPCDRVVILIYQRIWQMIQEKSGTNVILSSDVLTEIVKNHYGCDCGHLAIQYDRIIYGRQSVGFTEKGAAIRLYKEVYKKIKSKNDRPV